MTTLFLDRKEKVGVNSVYSTKYQRTIAIQDPCIYAVVLPAQRQPNGCNNYSVHRTAGAAAKHCAKHERAGIPFIIIDKDANIYTHIASKKQMKKGGVKLTLIDGFYYGLEAIGERLVDVSIDRLR